jgi:hypothetical protein
MTQAERRISIFPTPKYLKLIKAEAADCGSAWASVVNKIVENHFDQMPQPKIDHLINRYNSLDDDEIHRKKSNNHY